MSNTRTAPRSVVVVGDVTMDWNIGRLPTSQVTDYSWNNEDLVRTNLQRGGAILLAELIREVSDLLSLDKRHEIHMPKMPGEEANISPDDKTYHHSYANWALYNYEEKMSSANQDVFSWRVKNFVGLHRTTAERQSPIWEEALTKVAAANIIVLDDAALVFRYQPKEYWSKYFRQLDKKAWVVVKMARPVAERENPEAKLGKPEAGRSATLWDYLRDNHAERLIAIVTANDLRLSEARISRGLSWERTAQELALVLRDNQHLGELSRCAHVIVSFETAGVFLLTRQDQQGNEATREPQASLFFDPETIEGMWAQNYPGGMIGYASCLLASIVHQLMIDPEAPDMPVGIKSGLAAMRKLLKEGYGKHYKKADPPALKLNIALIADVITRTADEKSPLIQSLLTSLQKELSERYKGGGPADASLDFDSKAILKWLTKAAGKNEQFLQYAQIGGSEKEYEFAEAVVKTPARPVSDALEEGECEADEELWTILNERCPSAAGKETLAKSIVEFGVKDSLKDIPQGKFDKLVTVDRREIESYRSISTLIREYTSREHQERPLSIAVFGPPGAGKSFGISAVARAVMNEQGKKLTFNLSQFNDPAELLGALHQVRDEALANLVPLVFWDEFDTSLRGEKLGWLRYFLAPMQDGKFQEGQITHPIGRAIFVFAGGTCESMEGFDKSKSKYLAEKERFKDIKGPDFVSRLKGYIDILGPNSKKNTASVLDHIIRRAILLRSQLEQNAQQLFSLPGSKGRLNIDPGVMIALLKVPEYKHGARSMESIINMSQLTGKSRFERSSLPSEEQLNLHVDGRKFYSLTEQGAWVE